jgi:hypothetical protein
METKDVALREERQLTAKDIRKQVNLIQEVMKGIMKKDEHYGVIPGCNKPSLYKPGAEKLNMTFRLSPDYEELPGSAERDDFVGYKIKCTLTHIPTSKVAGSGLGACNSKEKKYRTRSVYLNKATEEEKAIGKEEIRTKRDGSSYKVLIIPQDPWDVQNTIYKMACKRALIAAVLNATAASDIFSQDIEEDDTIDYSNGQDKPPLQEPQAKSKPNGNNAYKAMLEKFEIAKQTLGEEAYYVILGNNGFERSNQIRDLKTGEKILSEMRKAVKSNG